MIKYKRIANALLAMLGIDVALWAGLIIVGLYGLAGSPAGWCAVWWITITAIAVIAKICVGVNLINPAPRTSRNAAERVHK